MVEADDSGSEASDPTGHKPAWQRADLAKELQEIGDIEAAAIRIRRGLQNMHEESEGAEVDVDAAALMMELRGAAQRLLEESAFSMERCR